MQLDTNVAMLAIGAVAVLAALLLGAIRLFGKQSPSAVATTLLVLLAAGGAALVIWGVTRTHLIAEVSPNAATQVTTANRHRRWHRRPGPDATGSVAHGHFGISCLCRPGRA